MDWQAIGKRLAEQRKYIKKISQEKMAEELGVYQADISNIERAVNGSGINDFNKLERYAEYLDISMEALLFGANANTTQTRYDGDASGIVKLNSKKKINQIYFSLLANLVGSKVSEIDPFIYQYKDFHIYIVPQVHIKGQSMDDGYVFKLPRFFVMYHSDVIAAMTLYQVPAMNVFCHGVLPVLQRVLNPNVLDALDMYRTMNPYYIFWLFAENSSEKEKYADLMNQRQEELKKFANDPAVFIEHIYVMEDWRQRGICRLMLDILKIFTGDATIWLNMEPSSGSELMQDTGHYPTCTQAQVGQMNLNAVIAEKLGFTIDPDYWHRNVEVLDSNGNIVTKQVVVCKCAYKISRNIASVIKNDGKLVEEGRELQKQKQQGHKNSEGFITKHLRYADKNGKFVSEVFIQTRDKIRCIVGITDKPHYYEFFLSDRSVFTYGFDVPKLEKYGSVEESWKSVFHRYFVMVRMVLDSVKFPRSEDERYLDLDDFENDNE